MMTRVAYIWSQELQDIADQLPANRGRSSMVHGLIHALGFLEDQQMDDEEEPLEPTDPDDMVYDSSDDGEDIQIARIPRSTGRATIISPMLQFGAEDELKRYHDPAYVDFLLKTRDAVDDWSECDSESSSGSRKRSKNTTHGLEYDCPPFPTLDRYASLVAASTVTACHLLASGSADITINWDGGRHHALRNRASGFCYVADIVLGIMHLVKHGTSKRNGRPRVMYLDLDIHYGDGVAQAFLSPSNYAPVESSGKKPPRPPNVLTLSLHHAAPDFFPPMAKHSGLPSKDSTSPFTLSIPLKSYPSPMTYASIWTSVERIKKAFDPDYVVLQLGVDGLPGDRIGQYGNWAIDGVGGMRWCVEQVKSWGIPLCVLGGGGYNHANTARAWAIATATMLETEMPVETEIPDHKYHSVYAPTFTFETQACQAHIPDENDQGHLDEIKETFTVIAQRIHAIVSAQTVSQVP